MKSSTPLRKVGIIASLGACVLIGIEHVLSHGVDLNPIDHWISEYALSESLPARMIMGMAFVALATVALSHPVG